MKICVGLIVSTLIINVITVCNARKVSNDSTSTQTAQCDQLFYEIAKSIPNRQLAMKLDQLESPIGFMDTAHGYDVYGLQSINGTTRFTFQAF